MSQRALLAGVVLAALAAGAAAQADEAAGTPAPSRSAATTTAPGGPVPDLPTGLAPTESRAKRLIGGDVYGPDNTVIGTVADLIVDLGGRITAYVVSIGGFLGIGSHRVAVPTDDVKFGEDGRLTVNLTREQLAAAPEFDFGERAATRAGPMAAPSGASTGPR
jgi:sporulation protein YlmC with PRC-barrel domain